MHHRGPWNCLRGRSLPAFFILKENRRVKGWDPVEMWGAEAYLAQSQRIPGVSSWVLQWWILHREKARPSSGLLSSSRSEFLARGLCPRQSSPPTTVVSCYSFSATHHKKKSLQGILRPDKGPDRNGGWVQELSESRRVWPRPTSRQSKPPVFPRASIRALEPRGPCRKYGKWRARPLDQTGNAFFLSSGGSEMSPSWRLDTSGHRGSPHPAGVRWLDRTTKVTEITRDLVGPDDSPCGWGGSSAGQIQPSVTF